MTHKEIIEAISHIRPNAEWLLSGDDYSKINWLDAEQAKPTIKEIEAEIAKPSAKPELTVQQKLASIGLTINDLKALLV
jgi:hypothetical protein